MARLGERLAAEFGRGFEAENLHRMVQFAQAFPSAEIVATLSRQLSWSHLVDLPPLKTEQARTFYAQQCAEQGWSGRELRRQIERKAYERSAIASVQQPGLAPSALPAGPTRLTHPSHSPSHADPGYRSVTFQLTSRGPALKITVR